MQTTALLTSSSLTPSPLPPPLIRLPPYSFMSTLMKYPPSFLSITYCVSPTPICFPSLSSSFKFSHFLPFFLFLLFSFNVFTPFVSPYPLISIFPSIVTLKFIPLIYSCSFPFRPHFLPCSLIHPTTSIPDLPSPSRDLSFPSLVGIFNKGHDATYSEPS